MVPWWAVTSGAWEETHRSRWWAEHVYLFEELQLNGVLQELSHSTGAMIHKSLLIKCYWLSLKIKRQHNGCQRKASTHYILYIQYPAAPASANVQSNHMKASVPALPLHWPTQSAERSCSCRTELPESWGRLVPHRLPLLWKPSLGDFLKTTPVG